MSEDLSGKQEWLHGCLDAVMRLRVLQNKESAKSPFNAVLWKILAYLNSAKDTYLSVGLVKRFWTVASVLLYIGGKFIINRSRRPQVKINWVISLATK